jgi:hypothetical protein
LLSFLLPHRFCEKPVPTFSHDADIIGKAARLAGFFWPAGRFRVLFADAAHPPRACIKRSTHASAPTRPHHPRRRSAGLYEDMKAGIHKNFAGFTAIDSKDDLIGPWNPG